jgi:hypothetical protein
VARNTTIRNMRGRGPASLWLFKLSCELEFRNRVAACVRRPDIDPVERHAIGTGIGSECAQHRFAPRSQLGNVIASCVRHPDVGCVIHQVFGHGSHRGGTQHSAVAGPKLGDDVDV